MAQVKPDPSRPSGEHDSMAGYWRAVRALEDGIRGLRAGGREYLPEFQSESRAEYERRLSTSRVTMLWSDILDALVAKPFAEPVSHDELSGQLNDFVSDVDLMGTPLTAFAEQVFRAAIADGLAWILTDFSGSTVGMTLDQERTSGARPFWQFIRADRVLAVEMSRVAGRDVITDVRIAYNDTVHDSTEFTESVRSRVLRMFTAGDTVHFQWWDSNVGTTAANWYVSSEGVLNGIDEIPLTRVAFGRERGAMSVNPPLRDALELQLALYRDETALEEAKVYTAFAMLAANGLDPATGDDGEPIELIVGPRKVLYGTTNAEGTGGGSWAYIEPSGSSLTFLAARIDKTISDIRELGKQPLSLTPGITVVSSAYAAAKTHSAVASWAVILEHGLSRAIGHVQKWFNLPVESAGLTVYKDFDVGLGDSSGFEQVLSMGRGTADAEPFISRDAVVDEAKRRGILSPNYDGEADLARIDYRRPEEGDG